MTRPTASCLAAPALALAWALVSSAPLAADDVRGAAQRWLAGYDKALAAVVATETYTQQVRRKEADAVTESASRRVVSSEFAWVPVLGDRDVIGVRAVRSIDDHIVGEPGRLDALLRAAAPDRDAQVQTLLAESVRHLEVPSAVNFNFPTFALAYLRPENAERAKWSVRDGPTAETAELRFRERDRTLVRTPEGQRVKAEGSLVVERAAGRVLESRLQLADDRRAEDEHSVRQVVRYGAHVRYVDEPRIGLLVPSVMEDRYERYDTSGRDVLMRLVIHGRATYTDYRRFQTDARIVP
jgi:hypothetical protein